MESKLNFLFIEENTDKSFEISIEQSRPIGKNLTSSSLESFLSIFLEQLITVLMEKTRKAHQELKFLFPSTNFQKVF